MMTETVGNPQARYPRATMRAWQVRAARWSHRAPNVLMLAIPISGGRHRSAAGVSVVDLGRVRLPNPVPKDRERAPSLRAPYHTLNFGLARVVTVHVGAALRHRFVDHDGVVARMLPGRGR